MGLLKDIKIAAGVNKDDTVLAARARWTDSDRIRFINGLPQKLGGWEKRITSQFDGKCRGLFAWQDGNDVAWLAVGTHKHFYVLAGATLTDITPVRASGNLTNPFDTVDGSDVVTVNDASHGASSLDFVNLSGASAVGGITLDGEYQLTVVDSNSYTVTHSASATSTVNGGGGTVAYVYEISIGREDAGQGTGFGVGAFGAGTYNTPRSTFVILPPRTWSIDQWGQYINFCPRGGSIYQWELTPSTRATTLANAPTSNTFVFVTDEQHLVVLGAGGSKMKVQWCDQSDNTVWTPSDQVTAGSRVLTGGSELLMGVRAKATNILFSDGAVWSMTHIGGQDIFGFDQIAGGASGIIGPQAACEVYGDVFWMGKENFFWYNGTVQPIPYSDEIKEFVFDNLTDLQKAKCYCHVNSLFKEIWWLYPTATENTNYVKYNYNDKVWDVGTIARTAGIDAEVFSKPVMTGPDLYIYNHETGVDADGSAMDEYIESSGFMIGDGQKLMDIIQIVPDFKNLTGTIKVSFMTRKYPQSTAVEEWETEITSATETVDCMASGRIAQYRIESNEVGSDWGAGVFLFDIQPNGDR